MEAIKLVRGPEVPLAAGTVVAAMLIGSAQPDAQRTEFFDAYMPFAFLAAVSFLAGGIVSAEFAHRTFKEMILSSCGRPQIYFSKLAAATAALSAVFLVYGVLLAVMGDADSVGSGDVLLNQYITVLQQGFIMFNLAFLLRGFSALGASAIACILVYRTLWMLPDGPLSRLDYFSQFASAEGCAQAAAVCGMVACVSCAVGLLVFSKRELF